MNEKTTLLWMSSAGCGGCTQSMLNYEADDLLRFIDSAGFDLLWHPVLSISSSESVSELIENIQNDKQRLDILLIEGAILMGPEGLGSFHKTSLNNQPMYELVKELAHLAGNVVAVGSCAAFGGFPAAGINKTGAVGLQYQGAQLGGLLKDGFNSKSGLPVVNVAGCPIHPAWLLETLIFLSRGELSVEELDEFARPRLLTDHLVHHGCPRNEFFEYKASAKYPSDQGCLMENLGCVGTQARGDCNTRLWNGEGSCNRGGFACIACTDPEFSDPGNSFLETHYIGGIPGGLPTDMPKAWFVALASLSKAATPRRVTENARSETIKVPPAPKHRKR